MSKFLVVRLNDPGHNTRLSDRIRILVGVVDVKLDVNPLDGSTILKVVLTPDANVDKVADIVKFLGGVDTVDICGAEEHDPNVA